MRTEAPIERIEVAAFRVPTDRPEADGTLAWDATVMVTCEIAAGGETGFGYGYADEATALFVTKVLSPVLEGAEALDVGARWRAMLDQARNHGRAGVAAMAVSVCDGALHDLRGKLLGAPLAVLLGRCHERAALYGSGGFTTYSATEMDEQIGGWVAGGFKAIKIKIVDDVDREAERVGRARCCRRCRLDDRCEWRLQPQGRAGDGRAGCGVFRGAGLVG